MPAVFIHRSAALIGLAAILLLSSQPGTTQDPVQQPLPEKKDQLAADSAKLLQLATELKAAIDKSTKDQLSITVIKKADEVEKLARKVREEMKSAPADNSTK